MEKRLGIVFAGGEGPTPESLGRLFAGLPPGAVTVAADSGLLIAEAAGIRPDWIVGDMDSLDDQTRLLNYPAQSVIRHPVDKDYTDTELALDLLWEKGCGDVWIIGGGGGRIAHLFAVRDIFERKRCPCRWITAGEDIRCINAPDGFAAALEPGEAVSVFPLGEGPWEAESAGLKWPLKDLPWNKGFFGLSNEAETGSFEIRSVHGRFLVIVGF